jgi:hypothetical protein
MWQSWGVTREDPRGQAYQERKEIGAGAMLQDNKRDMLSLLAKTAGKRALLVKYSVNLVD